MPRAALIAVMLVLLALSAAAKDPHLDLSLVPSGCAGCHEGHGSSGSPMLGTPQKSVCLGCHESQAAIDRQKALGRIGGHAKPPIVGADLALPFSHPVSDKAFSEHEEGTVACTSCHSPHRRSGGLGTPAGQPKPSPRDPRKREHELCDGCHGGLGPVIGSRSMGQRVDPGNVSSHPVRASAKDRSPSVRPELAGKEINCSDCHGGRPGQSARGVHGSTVRGLLVKNYVATDGAADPITGYELCWNCHEAKAVMDESRSTFPLHKLHVMEEHASCATCHDAHGSSVNRSLVPFGIGGVPVAGVSPSIKAGSLAFSSDAPGSGTCSLTCHGYDHAPESYGLKSIAVLKGGLRPTLGAPLPGDPGQRRRGVGDIPRMPRVPRTLPTRDEGDPEVRP